MCSRDHSGDYEKIGANEVAVPNYLYKIVFDPELSEAISLIMPNRQLKTSDMPKFLVPIREVESKTGLNFLNTLASDVQDKIESNQAADLW
ncbi:MAG TPA: DNA/RNA non-specific endonuclease [Desulfuromonadaceae bacterium]|jgi:endonuclease G